MHAVSSALSHVDGPKMQRLLRIRGPEALCDLLDLQGFKWVNEQNEEQPDFNKVVFTFQQKMTRSIRGVTL